MMLRVMCQKFCATRSGPTYSNFCSGQSAEVTTAWTPGSAAAIAMSIERMRAWACGERRTRPTSMPGIVMSEPYCAVPVTLGTPSGRTGRVPTHLNCLTLSREVMSSMAASPDCRVAAGLRRELRGRRANASALASLWTADPCWTSVSSGQYGDASVMLEYTAPSTVEEAVRALAEAPTAKILSGGTDLLVQLRSGRAKPDLIVDIKQIPGISGIRAQDGGFVIGAATPGAVIGEHKALQRAWPGVVEAANLIGSTQVQGRASLAGNLCNASPADDSVPALVAGRATCVVAGPNGGREVPVEGIATGPGRTSWIPGEFIVEFHLPKRPPRSAD